MQHFKVRSIPNDQYTCSECPLVPEILNIFYNTNEIELKCKAHGIKKLPLKEYFLKEKDFIYNNLTCQICHKKKLIKYHINIAIIVKEIYVMIAQ